MLSKEDFISAMEFFDRYDEIRDTAVKAIEPLFDGNGLIFKGCDTLYNKYLELLNAAMDLDPEDDIITYYLYDRSNNIYGAPNASGICEKIGEADYEFVKISVGDKEFIIKNAEDLYDYLVYTLE